MADRLYDYSQVTELPEVLIRKEILLERIRQISSNNSILEVGVGAGDITIGLVDVSDNLTCIDMDQQNLNLVENRFKDKDLKLPNMMVGKIEDANFKPASFDNIILLGLLEHIEFPVDVLNIIKKWLRPDGKIHITVNLCNSIHRWLGVMMNHIDNVKTLSKADKNLGHYRVYSLESLKKDILCSELKITLEDPHYLKPFPTSMIKDLPYSLHEGLRDLGRKFPEFASYIYLEVVDNNAK